MKRLLFTTTLAVAVAVQSTPSAWGHTKPRAAREIVRTQGIVHTVALPCAGELATIRVLNRNIRFCASDTRRIAVTTDQVSPDHSFPAQYTVQGERAELARITAAKPGETLTILGEWRPGRSDLFLIALDVCRCNENDANADNNTASPQD